MHLVLFEADQYSGHCLQVFASPHRAARAATKLQAPGWGINNRKAELQHSSMGEWCLVCARPWVPLFFITKWIWERDIQSLKRKQKGKERKDWKRLIRVVFPLWIISFSIKLPFLFAMLFLVFPGSHLKSVSQQLEKLLRGRTLACLNPWVPVSAGRNKNKMLAAQTPTHRVATHRAAVSQDSVASRWYTHTNPSAKCRVFFLLPALLS